MSYEIHIPENLEKRLHRIPKKDKERIMQKIDALENNPRPPDCKKLQGRPQLYRIRSGDYRIIYSIKDDMLIVLIIDVGNRKEIYR